MQMRLPEFFCDAKQAIEDTLEGNNRLILGRYGSLLANACTVQHFHITNKEDEESLSNLELLITYKERIINSYDKFEEVPRTQVLKVLTPKGDKLWPYNMVIKVWDGRYPSSVAINEETGQVYLLNLRMSGLELVSFATLTENQLEAIKEELNEVSPYRIRLDEEAMFQCLVGSEGNNHLKETLYIEFDCGVKLQVHSDYKKG